MQTEIHKTTNCKTILAVDIGTTGMKMGVFLLSDDALSMVRQYSQEYKVNIYNDGLFGDIEQEKWETAFIAGCKQMEDLISDVDVISLSGTTPGLTAMDKSGQESCAINDDGMATLTSE